MDSMITVNGTRLFVDQRGPSTGPPVLFIHGGPGHSCWDFMSVVGDRLAEAGIRIIGVDQRGVLRSAPLPPTPPLTAGLLIEDFEALRDQLAIDRWAILGHSAGAGYALDYALQHPGAITRLILDCPSLDADATDRYRLPKAADLLDSIGEASAAERCRQLAGLDRRITAEDRSWEAMQQLGNSYMELFLHHDPSSRDAYHRLMESAPKTLDWSKGMSHAPLIADMYRNRTTVLGALTVASMLLHGQDDLVTAPSIVEHYRPQVGGYVITIEAAGHFPYIEQPAQYVSAVAEFVISGSWPARH